MSDFLSRLLFFAIAVLIPFSVNAQEDLMRDINLQWEQDLQVIKYNGQTFEIFAFPEASVDLRDNDLPVFATRIKLPSFVSYEVDIVEPHYIDCPVGYRPKSADLIKNRIIVEQDHSHERGDSYAELRFCPIVNSNAGLRALKSFKIRIRPGASLQKATARTNYTSNSVLNQGEFFKFATSETGVYRLDKAFFDELGLEGSINCSNIRIYGNGGGMLPQSNEIERADDLLENPISVVDQNGNNQFEEGDYVLFYGEGPNDWVYNENQDLFEHFTNLYDSKNYYFLNVDIGAGKRIGSAQQLSAAPDNIVDSYTHRQFHETEIKNPLKSGRYWLGEEFSAVISQDFNFQIPDIVSTEKAKLGYNLAGKSKTSGSQFQVYANGSLISTVPFGAVTGTSEESEYCKTNSNVVEFASTSTNTNINLQFSKSNPDAKGWLDYLNLNTRRSLKLNEPQMMFRDQYSVGTGAVSRFDISHNGSITVWDVSNVAEVKQLPLSNTSTGSSITVETEVLKEFVCFNGSDFLQAEAIGGIERQNVHEEIYPDLIIVSHPDFLAAAERLADFHREMDGMQVAVFSIEHVYNEFSSGRQDVSAVRDMAKMFYDRATNNGQNPFKYLQLVGDASYDYKSIKESPESNTNFIPTYQSRSSYNGHDTYCTDDYFGLLDASEGQTIDNNTSKLDIAVGRLPVTTLAQANAVVDKLIHYKSEASRGDWLNNMTFIADDPDSGLQNTHFNDAEHHTHLIDSTQQQYNIDKIYLDAFEQVNTSGESRYPTVTEAISRKIFSGTAIVNYAGHGGPNSWTQERILDIPTILSWENLDKLPLFITATCSFSRYDDPALTSGGEELLLNPNGGCFGIVTTVRLVYAYSNKTLNNQFLQAMYNTESGQYPTVGEAMRVGKNNSVGANANNNRKFILLGDPAITMNFPKHKIRTLSINGASLEQPDTLRALQRVTVVGQVEDNAGNLLTDFNGTVYPTVFDRKLRLSTLGNDYPSQIAEFDLQKNAIFKGAASVNNGSFEFSFVVPKDISFQVGDGRISYYAKTDNMDDASGYTNALKVGGIDPNFEPDEQGPEIDIYLNDRNFVFGGLSNDEPLLIVDLFDENGINTVGTGIGHDIASILNENSQSKTILNDYYQAELDNYQQGSIEFPMSKLDPGRHSLEVSAWDVYNNSGKALTEFLVAESADLALEHVLNYPNPFTDQTAFWFEHNYPGQPLNVQIQIYTLSGKVIKTINREIMSKGTRISDITWDGKDEYGNKIGRGVYIYKLNVQAGDNQSVNKLEKLVILK